MRFLSKEEVEEWIEIVSGYGHYLEKELFNDRKVNYHFSFSISKNNIDRFERLLSRFLKEEFKIGVFRSSLQPGKISLGDDTIIHTINQEDINYFKGIQEIQEHRSYNVDFIKYTYNISKIPAIPCIIYIQTIKDVIKIIGDFYGFDENGNEICSIKHKIGSIVSLKNDKSDYFIESLEFIRENTDDYILSRKYYDFSEELILYKLLKVVNNIKSQVLEFSHGYVSTTSINIIPNRGQRLNDILDN
jgi:hypothetical protein